MPAPTAYRFQDIANGIKLLADNALIRLIWTTDTALHVMHEMPLPSDVRAWLTRTGWDRVDDDVVAIVLPDAARGDLLRARIAANPKEAK